ncbi:MAG TPA: bifunctional phosphoglucose/phosphomannose isomerase [Syntrophomonadaceae bacterium]|nr:bifunctional phosphoglucose/phosphomannose isomerase [Syntrophomonadaceae bacterium]HPR93854.1 bifunctional phosphoglucose/phosphomannose isomerase [Syntrophomonadaceae bacterium]
MIIDSEIMAGYIHSLPRQFEDCLQMEFDFIERYQGRYENVLICGMGGSAIGGDILRTWGQLDATVPLIINRDYRIPHFINEHSLVIAVSYSGNTEETLQAYHLAREIGAPIIGVTSGGKLADLARKNGDGLAIIPGDLVPRAASGYLLAPVALILQQLAILPGAREAIMETAQLLASLRREIGPEVTGDKNQARQIAAGLKNSLPLIWGVVGTSEAAAMRWKGQINENAKAPAFFNLFPELNHNEIVGFELSEEILGRIAIIILKDKFDNERIKKRIKITKDIVLPKVKAVIEVESSGESFLARLYSLIYTGDYVSYYLAMEYGIDPTPVKVIDFLKNELGK